jgi:Trk-type K+ transport system membrane component
MVFVISLILIVGGAASYFALEPQATLKELTVGQQIWGSIFQSVTCRTAGFNTLDTTAIRVPTALMMMLLMGIGGSPGGTAGGVKTTTMGIAFLSALATARGKQRIEFLRRHIPEETVARGMTVLVFAAVVVGIATFLLTLTEPNQELTHLLFEEVSAFGTVGLSMGVTSGLSAAGKYIIIFSMFLGRVGPLTIAIALSQRTNAGKFEYPTEDIMVM